MKRLSSTILFLLITSLPGIGQEENYNHYLLLASLPQWSVHPVSKIESGSNYTISDHMNPFYFEADFNNDGNRDVAVSIVEQDTGKKGILIFHGELNEHFIIGAGQKIESREDDLNWMDIWKLCRDIKVQEMYVEKEKNLPAHRQLELAAPGIEVVKFESAAGLIYWNGNSYKWAWLGD